MIYLVGNVSFEISHHCLYVNTKKVPAKQKTLDTLQCFLNSNNQIISKEQMMTSIWEKTIVTESSLFKQVQLVRKIFEDAGLGNDAIESIYGTGYKVSPRIIINQDHDNNSATTQSESQIPPHPNTENKRIKISIVWIALAVLLLFIIFLLPNDTQTPNSLDSESRESIVASLKLDWKQGLANLNKQITQENSNYSDNDLGFLYQAKGLAELQLQRTNDSVKSLQQSLKYFKDNNEDIAESYILLSRAYSTINDTPKALETIDKAIDLYKDNPNKKMVKALMTKSLLLRKSQHIENSIDINIESLNLAKKLNDKRGEMIAVSNLAATRYQLGELEEAEILITKGLELSIKHGTSQHIANSYTLISAIQQSKGDLSNSLMNIERALKYQITNNNVRYLAPKLYNYIYLLIQFRHNESADKLINLSFDFLEKVSAKNETRSKFRFLKGLNYQSQKQWQQSIREFENAIQTLGQSDLHNYKDELYTSSSLSYFLTGNYLKSIEYAKLSNLKKTDSAFEKSIILALNYFALQQQELSASQLHKAESQIDTSNSFYTSIINEALKIIPEKNQFDSIRIQIEQKINTDSAATIDQNLQRELTEFISGI